MENRYNFIFKVFRFAQRALRGSGLGRFRIFRGVRDLVFNLVRPRGVLTIEIHGLKFKVDTSFTTVVPDLLRDDTYVAYETELVNRIVKKGDVFVDMGANIGYYTVLAARIVGPEGKVIAFEAHPENFAYIEQNVALNRFGNVELVQKAIADCSGKIQFFVDRGATGGHHLADFNDGAKPIWIDTISLDEYLESHSTKIDFVKMDIEGSEVLGLRGMQKALDTNPDVTLLVEVFPYKLGKSGFSVQSLVDQLTRNEFQFSYVDEHNHQLRSLSPGEVVLLADREERYNILCARRRLT